MYLSRLNNENLNPRLNEAFKLTKSLDSKGTYSWYTFAKNVSQDINIDIKLIEETKTLKQTKMLKPQLKKSYINYYQTVIDDKINNLNENNKIYLYKFLKSNINNQMQYYLSHPSKETRKMLTKFRISEHCLFIETGRYTKIPRNERKCKICNILDDEFHFFFNCKINKNIREIFLKYYIQKYVNFNTLNFTDKLVIILNPSTPNDVKAVVSFIKESLELRKGEQ